MTVTLSLECFMLTYNDYISNSPIQLRYVNCLNKRKSIKINQYVPKAYAGLRTEARLVVVPSRTRNGGPEPNVMVRLLHGAHSYFQFGNCCFQIADLKPKITKRSGNTEQISDVREVENLCFPLA